MTKKTNKIANDSGLKLKPETWTDILANYKGPEDFADIWSTLKKGVIERMLEGELDHHLGYPKGCRTISDNARNGSSSKTVLTDTVL